MWSLHIGCPCVPVTREAAQNMSISGWNMDDHLCHCAVYESPTKQDITGNFRVAMLQGDVNVSESGKDAGPDKQ